MVYRGKIKNGMVVLEANATLPEGTEVLVQPAPKGRWKECIGTISEEDAREMLKAI